METMDTSEIQEAPKYYTKVDWTSGPNKLCPADSYISTRLDKPVKLRSNEADMSRFPPISIYGIFKRTVEMMPDHPALAYKHDPKGSDYTFISFIEYWKACRAAAKSFIKLGLDTSECVCIMGFNSVEWFISTLGAIFAGGVSCGIYTTNSVESCELILDDTQSKIIVVENKQQLDKIMSCRQRNTFKKVIQYWGKVENNYNGQVISWKEFIELSSTVDNILLELRTKTIAPNKCATLIYTSGTTGTPKAAMISHDSITYLSRVVGFDVAKLKPFKERFVTYLPLSHIAAQVIDIFAPLTIGITVYFAQPDALRGGLLNTLKEVRPTYLFGVPRIWEKMEEGIKQKLKNLTGFKKSMFEWASKLGALYVKAHFQGQNSVSLEYEMAKTLVLNKIHEELGLDKCASFYVGAAPVTRETLDFFVNLGIPLVEVYGMSESTGPHSLGTHYMNRITSIGAVNPFNRSKVIDKDAEGSGELAINGRHIFMGYLNDEKKTIEAFDADGWLKTGDIAKIDNAFIYITGRLKELIITAGGENVAPVPIEENIKTELPNLISNCMLIGDKRKYLIVLLTLKSKINMDSMQPMDDLMPECIEYLNSIGSASKRVSQITDKRDPIVYEAIDKAIKKANEKSVSRASKVQKFIILPRDFSVVNGELGPTLKMRRPIIAKMYEDIINNCYAESGGE